MVIEHQKIEALLADGKPLIVGTLPSAVTTRWTMHRKAEVVSAVFMGVLSFAQACERYQLSSEELAHWQRAMTLSGLKGLRATFALQE
jgi:hypothetical protein